MSKSKKKHRNKPKAKSDLLAGETPLECYLRTHPKVERTEIVSKDGKAVDFLVYCPGRALPFSMKEIFAEARERRNDGKIHLSPGPLQCELMLLSGWELTDEMRGWFEEAQRARRIYAPS